MATTGEIPRPPAASVRKQLLGDSRKSELPDLVIDLSSHFPGSPKSDDVSVESVASKGSVSVDVVPSDVSVSLEPSLRLFLGGTICDLVEHPDLIERVRHRLGEVGGPPLLLASANLDHIQHFGSSPEADLFGSGAESDRWLVLLDGMPLVTEAARLTGHSWPRLAGADLLPELLDSAEATGATVGIVGGTAAVHQSFMVLAATRWPALHVAGLWSPTRDDLDDPDKNRELAHTVAATGVDLLIVGLGKPLQERWLHEWAGPAGIRVGACFGGALDLLTGVTVRAPLWAQQMSAEWLWRLAQEPRRLFHRYLIAGPPAYLRLRRRSGWPPVS